MSRIYFRFAWLALLLLSAGMACNLINSIEGANQARRTAQAIATQAQGLGESVEDNLATVQAEFTEESSQLFSTLDAVGTDVSESGLLETAQAKITEDGSQLLATLDAVATQGFPLDLNGEIPDDVPVVDEGTVTYLATGADYVSYQTSLDYLTTLKFYKSEMPANGWTFIAEGSVETDDTAVLKFEKDSRAATITVTGASANPTTVQVILAD